MRKIEEFKELVIDILRIVKICITTFWFWFPVLFYSYVFLQLWMLFYISPLTLLILPITIFIYVTILEKKRVKKDVIKTKQLISSHPLFAKPDPIYSVYERQESNWYKLKMKKDKVVKNNH